MNVIYIIIFLIIYMVMVMVIYSKARGHYLELRILRNSSLV